MKNMPFETLNI